MESLSLEYFTPARTEKRGRPRKKRTRGPGGTGCFPLAARLGVAAHASPSFAEDVVLECLKTSYAEAAESFSRRGICVSWTRMQKIVNSVGRKGVEDRERRLSPAVPSPSAAAAGSGPSPAAVAAGRRIAVSMDGGRVLIRTSRKGRRLESGRHGYDAEWREPKLFLVYELDENGRKARNGFQRCGGTMEGPDRLAKLLAAELKSIGAADAECVVFLGDGAKWIWNRIDGIASEAGIGRGRLRLCLDYYHAVEHLSVIAGAYPFGSRKKQEAWMGGMKKLLLEATPEKFLAELKKYRKKGNSNIRREIQYFTANAGALRFASLRGEKLPIGSGSIESAVRRIVNLRIKGAGIFWKNENVEQFMHLRCQLKSGNWNAFYTELVTGAAS